LSQVSHIGHFQSRKMINNLILASLLSTVFVLAIHANEEIDCARVPPSFWCKNPKIARQCNVEEQCKKFNDGSSGKKLLITLLFESLCPDCQEFITGALYNKVYLHFKDYVDIELVAYGNARKLNNGSIQCQHGPVECEINLYETCAIHFLQDPLPFIYCLELKIKMGIPLEKASETCYSKLHISHIAYDQIQHCFKSDKGKQLQLEAEERTDNAWPDLHRHVPWLYFNNVSLSDSQDLIADLPVVICDWLVGKKPDVCAGIGRKKSPIKGCLN